jgi:hypothetical protein
MIPVVDQWLAELSSKNIDQAIAAMLEQAACDDATERPSSAGPTLLPKKLRRSLAVASTPSRRAWARVFTPNAREQPKPSWRPPKAEIEAYGTSVDFVLAEDQLTYPAESAAFSASR